MVLTPAAKFSINRRSWGDREAQNRAVFAAIGRISSPVGELLLGPLPLAA